MRAGLAILALTAGCTVEATVGRSIPSSPERPTTTERGIVCSPSLLDFGRLPPSTTAERTLDCRLTPSGEGTVQRLAVLEGGSDDFSFTVIGAEAGTQVPLKTESDGTFSVRARFASNLLGGAQASLRLFPAQGRAFDLLARAEVDPNARCSIQPRPALLEFGGVRLGDRSRAFIALENIGTGTCSLGRVEFLAGTDPAFSTEVEEPRRLAPGQSISVPLDFVPEGNAGPRRGLLGVRGERDVLLRGVPVRGSGHRGEGRPSIRPAMLDFGRRGSMCVNPTTQTFEVVAGSSSVAVDIRMTADSSTRFSLSPLSQVLQPGEGLTVPVHLVPGDSGEVQGRAQIQIAGQEPSFVSFRAKLASDSLNEQSFSGAPPYRLAGPPAHGTVQVWLDEQELPRTWGGREVWALNYTDPQLILSDPPRDPQAELRIRYDIACTPDTCGDGVVDDFEECDDGNDDPHDDCLPQCLFAHCGDGVVRHGGVEECDDGNTRSGDGCNVVCMLERCGNGVVEGPEECDTGAGLSDRLPDACRSNCELAGCGDGVVDSGEACDDANDIATDGCVECRRATCGDGHVLTGVEECDDANRVDGDGCEADCTFPEFSFSTIGMEELAPASGGRRISLDRPINLPFPFRFLGRTVNQLDATQPGLMVFDGSTPSESNTAIPSNDGPSGLLAWWWDEMRINGAASVWVSGVPGYRTFTVRFLEITLDAQADALMSAEVQLFERSGAILVHYGAIVGSPMSTAGSASVGWESHRGSRGDDVLGCSPTCDLSTWPEREIHLYRP